MTPNMPGLDINERWLLNLLDTIDEGIHAVDVQGVTLVYNQAAAAMDGLNQSDVIGKHVLAVFPSLGQDTSTLMQVLKTGKSLANRPQTYTNYLGLRVHTVNTTLPITVDNKVIGAVEVAKDLTQVKRLAEQVLSLQAQVVGGAKGTSGKAVAGNGAQALYHFSDLITADVQMKEIKTRAELVARTFSPILVYGETGTGKELLVHAIHNASPRRLKPFFALNCAALPATLLEGILFGTVRGSFTGAGDRAGLFELADKGTLFLDEIQSMPLELQAKLLRVLQEGELLRVGDTRLRRVNVRVIAAMNQSPETALQKGELRQDLYYRINVVRLDLPPLRNRRDDIPLLVAYLIDKWNTRFAVNVSGISEKVMQSFLTYHWPGNVRELENAIEGAMNLVHEGWIQPDVLPRQIRETAAETDDSNRACSPADSKAELAKEELMKKESAKRELAKGEFVARPLVTGLDAPFKKDGTMSYPLPEVNPSGSFRRRVLEEIVENEGLPQWERALKDHGMNEFWHSVQHGAFARPPFPDIARAFERIVLIHALESTGGNIKRAAEKLGIPRQTLQYRVKQAGLGGKES